MMHSTVIISGEASETDSEEETNLKKFGNAVQGSVIAGEDSESEEDTASVSSAVSAKTQFQGSQAPDKSPSTTSLLHKKLREDNLHFYTDLGNFCQNVVDQARRQLNTVDRQLLKSQITLQSAVTSLKSLNSQSTCLRDKLEAVVTSNFLSNIKTSTD